MATPGKPDLTSQYEFTQVFDARGGAQQQYKVRCRYEYFSGKIQVPLCDDIAAGLPSVALLQASAAYSCVTVEWSAARTGQKPLLPSPVPLDTNWVLLYAVPVPETAEFEEDLINRTYVIGGVYAYAHLVPVVPGVNPLKMGTLPFDLTPRIQNQYSSADFSATVLQ